MNETSHQGQPNRLINASSPYLLQHAYNPVDWYPWGKEALEKAKKEDKPILVSIGYSACHWCHVMAHQSFENDTIAKIMNDNFICIKVDREERPDVDQIYMEAVQAMGQNGGWPLNVFLTADQKPFYGGTYFPAQGWAQLLQNVAKAYAEKRSQVEESAQQLTEALSTSEIEKMGLQLSANSFEIDQLDLAFDTLSKKFDTKNGGLRGAPKFPMPANWLWLMRYQHISKNKEAQNQLERTLDALAAGGIYDQVGGGFARYSTDDHWLVPHFEKMLYDNGQLMSLFAEAYTVLKKPRYKQVIYQTADWLQREMTANGGFYSALDADSEGEEGKFYIWTQAEINNALGKDAPLISAYYNTSESGNWEDGKNILHTTQNNEGFANTHGISVNTLNEKVQQAIDKLLAKRKERVRPGLDDKILAGWNGLMLKGLADAYSAFHDEKFLDMALANALFIENNMISGNKLYRNFKNGTASIDGYLEDYALVIDAYIKMYQITFDEHWLNLAKKLTEYTLTHFFDEKEGMFFYTDNSSQKLIARKKELFDNVIPASNSQMAINLYWLSVFFDKKDYKDKAEAMLARMSNLMAKDIAYVSNWAILYTYLATPTAEVAIVGEAAGSLRDSLFNTYHPNMVIMGAKSKSTLPLMQDKEVTNGKSTIYVCYNKTCKLPVYTIEDALKALKMK